ncbi:hypothetical protein MP228_000848 [Amoeboaphelidium protococcarum]|nr:hypothetical protein MP228_000848 [Amoeboaphelidium protococcarum]
MSVKRKTLGQADSRLNEQFASEADYGVPSTSQKASRISMGPAQRIVTKQVTSGLSKQLGNMDIGHNQQFYQNENRQSIGYRGAVPNSAVRRQSVYAGRPSGIGLATPQHAMKDPRSIRDKEWQNSAVLNLISFLYECGYEKDLSPKVLASPSGKDFQMIFKFLYSRLDPHYPWNPKKFEDDVPLVLRGIKYPFVDQISKSALFAVGSVNSWPLFLAALIWIVELIIATEQVYTELDIDRSEHFFYEYVCKAYQDFINGGTDNLSLNEDLEAYYQEKDANTVQELHNIEALNAQLEQEIQMLLDEEDPVVKAQNDKAQYENQLQSAIEQMKKQERQNSQLESKMKELKQELSDKNYDLQDRLKEKTNLETEVQNQELSPEDIANMNSERRSLQKNLDTLNGKCEKLSASVWNSEVQFQKKMEQCEKSVLEFNQFMQQLNLIQQRDQLDQQQLLKLNVNAKQSADMVNIDLGFKTRSMLLSHQSKLKTQCGLTKDINVKLKNDIQDYCTRQDDLQVQIDEIQSQIKDMRQQAQSLHKNKLAEVEALQASKYNVERELKRSRLEESRQLFELQKTAREMSMQYESLERQYSQQQLQMENELKNIAHQVASFKQHINKSLVDLDQFIASNLDEVEQISLSAESPQNDPELTDKLNVDSKFDYSFTDKSKNIDTMALI